MKHAVPTHRRHDMSDETWALLEPHLPGASAPVGYRPGQPIVYQCGVLDFANGRAMAGFAARLRRMEQTCTAVSFAGAIRGFGKNC